MDKINALARQAVGFDKERGDEISVSNFELNSATQVFKPKDKWDSIVGDIKKYTNPFIPILKYLIVLLIAYVFYKKVITPFVERMLSNQEDEDTDIGSALGDDEVKGTDSKLSETRKRIEEQLGGENLLNEDDIKYDVLVERMRDMISEKPQEIAALFQRLISDELGLEGGMQKQEKDEG